MSEGTIEQRLEELSKQVAALRSEVNVLNQLTGNTEAIRSEEIYGDGSSLSLLKHFKSANDAKSPVSRSLKNAYITAYCHDEEFKKLYAETRMFADFMKYLIAMMRRQKALPPGFLEIVVDIYLRGIDEEDKDLASHIVGVIEDMCVDV